MSTYILLYVFLVFLAVLQYCYKIKQKDINMLVAMTCFFLFIFVAFRGMGYDYDNYLGLYEIIHSGRTVSYADAGFSILCAIMPSFRLLLILMAALTIIPFYWIIKNKSEYAFLSLMIFSTTLLLPTVMGQMRQGLTIFVMIYAYFRWKGTKVFWILFALCVSLHVSALASLLFLIPMKRIYPLYVYVGLVIGAIVVSNLLTPVFAPLIGSIDALQGTNLAFRADYYTKTETLAGQSLSFNTAVMIRCFIFGQMYWLYRKDKTYDASTLNLFFLSIIIYLGLGFLPQAGGRIALCFSVFDIILVPAFLKAYRGAYRPLILVFFILLSGMRLVNQFNDRYFDHCYNPYKIELEI